VSCAWRAESGGANRSDLDCRDARVARELSRYGSRETAEAEFRPPHDSHSSYIQLSADCVCDARLRVYLSKSMKYDTLIPHTGCTPYCDCCESTARGPAHTPRHTVSQTGAEPVDTDGQTKFHVAGAATEHCGLCTVSRTVSLCPVNVQSVLGEQCECPVTVYLLISFFFFDSAFISLFDFPQSNKIQPRYARNLSALRRAISHNIYTTPNSTTSTATEKATKKHPRQPGSPRGKPATDRQRRVCQSTCSPPTCLLPACELCVWKER
jgi:hypothetical protein